MDKKAEFLLFVGIGAMTRDSEHGTQLASTAMKLAGYVKQGNLPDDKSAFELSLEYLDRFYGKKRKGKHE